MKPVDVLSVIRTTLTLRGEGVANDPVRRVIQYWDMDGNLLAEVDEWQTGSAVYVKQLKDALLRAESELFLMNSKTGILEEIQGLLNSRA